MLRFCDGHLRLRFVGPLGASGSESLRIGERADPLFDSRGFFPLAVCSRTAEDCQQRQIIHQSFPLLTPLEEFVLDLGQNVFDLGETIFAVRELVFGLGE